MNAATALDHYFQDLEARDAFSGVALITQGEASLYAAAYGEASRPWKIRNTLAFVLSFLV